MRATIQEKLEEIEDIESGEPITDDIIEDGKTYFGYLISKIHLGSDMSKNYSYRVSLTGHISRRVLPEDNTTKIVDEAVENIINKLKELNFKCTSEEVSISNNIKKNRITGYVEYSEINNKLII